MMVDGKLVSPSRLPDIDWPQFFKDVNVTTAQNTTYTPETGETATEYGNVFSIDLESKVSSENLERIETALKLAWLKQYPGMKIMLVLGYSLCTYINIETQSYHAINACIAVDA